MNSQPQSKEIVRLGMRARYLEARRAVAEKGMRLPPYPLLDRYVQKNKDENRGGVYADELLAWPEKDGVFRKGKDVKDPSSGWILPASYVPEEAVDWEGAGLFIVPEDVGGERGKMVVHAKSIIVLDGMIQTSNDWVNGEPHEITRIPLIVSPERFEGLPEEGKRFLHRSERGGLTSLLCGKYDNPQLINLNWGPDTAGEVMGVPATEDGVTKLQVEAAPEGKGILIKGASTEQIMALLSDARAEIYAVNAILQIKGEEELSKVPKLLDALQIKE